MSFRMPQITLRCAGCATVVDPLDPAASSFRCPNTQRAPQIDHVLQWDPITAGVTSWPIEAEHNPFLRYRTLQHAYWLARSSGMRDSDYVALVQRLDSSIAAAGVGFAVTPFVMLQAASAQTDTEVWAKVDVGNVAGSHKARHLFGLLLHIEARRISHRTPLAIASCGNAALAAATLAKAAKRPLHVFVPENANPVVLAKLAELGAVANICPRLDSDPPGDPCIHRFHEAVAKGALPFCVQGSENGLTIDGGSTMGHELANHFAMLGTVPDRMFVQVGGGALGSATFRGLRDALALGVIDRLPAMHFVQTSGAAPLARAWSLVAERAARTLGQMVSLDEPLGKAAASQMLRSPESRAAIEEALQYAVTHRSQFMWPWESITDSCATGILDDETYDWFELVRAMLISGGWPVVVTESQLQAANSLAANSIDAVPADETGTASLAGLLAMHDDSLLRRDEQIVVLLTGVRR